MRSIRNFCILALFSMPLVHAIGCGGGSSGPDADPFATFQACYDEHHTTESFSVQRAIEICCIDHPIGGAKANTVCGDTADTCKTYVTMNLMDPADATLAADITTACMDYVADRAG
jgi:hypothetical protein